MLCRSPTRFHLNLVQTTSGTPAAKTACVYGILGRQGAQLKFFQGGPGHQPQEKGEGSQLKNALTPIKFFASEPGARHVWDPRCEDGTSLWPFSAMWHSFKENFPQTLRGHRVTGRRGRAILSLCPGIPIHTPPVGSLRIFARLTPEPWTRPRPLGRINRKSQCSSMVDFLLTRNDHALSPEEWPVWPRAGPSTLVWIFEGKQISFFEGPPSD